jgi:hypothetical protein
VRQQKQASATSCLESLAGPRDALMSVNPTQQRQQDQLAENILFCRRVHAVHVQYL